MIHKITISEIIPGRPSTTATEVDGTPTEQVVFTQVIDGLDLSKIVLALNKRTRKTKTKTA